MESTLAVHDTRLEGKWFEPITPGTPTIVMLHEGLGSIALWKSFPRLVHERTGCGVLVYSRYGHGGSDRLTEKRSVDYLHTEGEVMLPAVLEALGIANPILLGHSDGASIAMIYAGKYPDRTRALILEAPHVFVEPKAIAGIVQTKHVYPNGLRSRLARYHADVDSTFWGWADIWLDPKFRSWNIESYLDSIRCPVLMIQGEDDEYGTTVQLDAIRARVPSAEIVLLDRCGHSPHRDREEDTLARIEAFVAGA